MSTAFLGPSPYVVSAASIGTTPAQSGQLFLGRAARVYFFVNVTTIGGSNLTTISIKLQYRYNDGTTATAYVDLPSDKGDKGTVAGTNEVTHSYTVAANQNKDFAPFFLDNPFGLADVQLVVSANAAGQAGESVTIRPVLA